MSTINTTIAHAVTLSAGGSYSSPLTIASNGAVINGGGSFTLGAGDGVYGPFSGPGPWTVANAGTVVAAYDGIDLLAGGSVGNTGSINGGNNGVYIGSGVGTVANSGTITSTNDTNYGVQLNAGGAVTNSGTGFISGGVKIYGASGIVVNSAAIGDSVGDGVRLTAGGTVSDTGRITGAADGVELNAAGYVSVASSGSVGGGGIGVYLGGIGTVFNNGSIVAANLNGGNFAIDLNGGGTAVNNAGAYLAGGIEVNNAAGMVVNDGRIVFASGDGILLASGGTVSGTGGVSATINGIEADAGGSATIGAGGSVGGGAFGVYITGGAGTVSDNGTISSTGGTAIDFTGTGTNLLTLGSGYRIVGAVAGSGNVSATNTVQLSGSVTVNYNGLTLSNFQDVSFGGGGIEALKVSNNTGTLPVTISGFASVGQTIDMTSIGTNGSIVNNDLVNHQLTIGGSGGTLTLQLDLSDGVLFQATSDGASGSDVTVVCYAAGTRILTASGEVAVEDLAIGDRVVTISGAAKPIKWIGRRAYGGRFLKGNRSLLPVRIARGALGDDLPRRDLCVSPRHALLIDGMLLPAEMLVNGVSIVQQEAVEAIAYYHIELASHDVVFAEGAAAETYVDCDNRGLFHNAAEFARLYPGEDRQRWRFCAPRVEAGPDLERIRARLGRRAGIAAGDQPVDTDAIWQAGPSARSTRS